MKTLRREIFITTGLSIVYMGINFAMPAAGINNRMYMDKSISIQNAAQNSLIMLLNCETGYRGYLLTKSPIFVSPEVDCVAHIDAHIKALKDLTASNPQEAKLMPVIEATASRLVTLSQTVVEHPPKNQTELIIQMTRGKSLMDIYRSQIASIMQQEESTLEARQLLMHDLRNFTHLSRFVFSLLLLSMLLIMCRQVMVKSVQLQALESLEKSDEDFKNGLRRANDQRADRPNDHDRRSERESDS